MSYLTLNGSRTSHKSEVSSLCFYWQRRKLTGLRKTQTKPRKCSVCDECQRLEKLARQEVKA